MKHGTSEENEKAKICIYTELFIIQTSTHLHLRVSAVIFLSGERRPDEEEKKNDLFLLFEALGQEDGHPIIRTLLCAQTNWGNCQPAQTA